MGKDIESRNHIITLSADKVIALPGGPGTWSEIELTIEYRKPLVLLSPNGEWDAFSKLAPAVKTVENAVEKI
jgi:predicted Rossmann-fold nucleotide-binding protein